MKRCVLVLLWTASCLPDPGFELRDKGVAGGVETTGFAAVGAIRSPRGPTCAATLVAPRVVVTVKSCVLAGTRAEELEFFLGPRIDASSTPAARGVAFFSHGGLPRQVGELPDEYANLFALALDRDPGVAPIVARTRPMTDAERGRSVQVVGYGETARGRGDGGLRRTATSTIWAVHTDDPIFVTTRHEGDGTHCSASDYGGPAILDGEVVGLFGWSADPANPCAIGARYFRVDRAADLIAGASALTGTTLPDPTEGGGLETATGWTCLPSNGIDATADRTDDACDCGCGVVDPACATGCGERGCVAADCDYCADGAGNLLECNATSDTPQGPVPGGGDAQLPERDPNQSCLDALRNEWQVDFEALAPVDTVQNGVHCAMTEPVRIRSPFHGRDGDVTFSGGTIDVECEFAIELANFADELSAESVTSFTHWGAYSCRDTDGGNASQHALGTAIDIASLRKNGQDYRVVRDWTDADAFLPTLASTMQASYFETVLTPDYNDAHHDHVHAGDWL